MSWEQERDENERLKAQRGMIRQVPESVGTDGSLRPAPESCRTETQLELFQTVPYSYDFVEKLLNQLPRQRQREHFRKLYLREYRSVEMGGERKANLFLRDLLGNRLKKVFAEYRVDVAFMQSFAREPDFLLDRKMWDEFDRTLTTVKTKATYVDDDNAEQNFVRKFNQFAHREMSKGTVPFYLLGSQKLSELAYKIATSFSNVQRAFLDAHLALQQEFTTAEINGLMLRIYGFCGKVAAAIGFPLAHWDRYKSKGIIRQEYIDCTLMKICDEKYWVRNMQKLQKQMIEHIAIACGEVKKHYSSYVSRNGLMDWRQQMKKNYDFLKSMIIENVDDPAEQAELFDMYLRSSANPALRRLEMMTRLNGLEQWADETEHHALFLTLTAPSAFHATLSHGEPNPKWNGASPRKTHQYLNRVWAQFRALLAKRDIGFYGMRVAEPHHDATPHWHLLVYVDKKHRDEVVELFKRKALELDGNERGAKQHRCKVEDIDHEKGSATAYIAKYISKNIDGFAGDEERSDEDPEMLLKDNAKRARAWASIWGIRQFQFYGDAGVGVWRELRRLTAGDITDEELEEMRICADVGCYASYLQRQGGAMVKRADIKARLHYEETEPNQFGETRQKIDGVRLTRCLAWVKSRLKKWVIKRKPSTKPSTKQGECSANSGEFSPPWTCVSNCNHPKGKLSVNDIAEMMKIHRNEIEQIKFCLSLHKISSRWVTDYRLCRLVLGDKVGIYGGMFIHWDGRELVIE
ncbi:replication endonuclease [Pasteurella bettyae]|uniref:Bacteriophage replication protein A domain protein n=1 Tax=Pasteurella bettyae CCUG 2042 TaxID=1095749 RepID=I3DK93_9PAST|nr:replication endonuclease [Pasteurella bettyae]EIJ72136.1 bacteriophage replication protein A domain protein [Pasteurella bettyae CCUG 2042]SUB20788.1 Bacteriophage replication gene A protein (GPA) [Pasteurella bettyae]